MTYKEGLTNSGGITDMDGNILIEGINEVKPNIYVEIGTGIGNSTDVVFNYLIKNFQNCEFYTIDSNINVIDNIVEKYGSYTNFHAIQGLSVKKNEMTKGNKIPYKIREYNGKQDVLRNLFDGNLLNKKVDIFFIDSIKESCLSEFKIIVNHLQKNGIIYCHDILNGGKGVEIKKYIDTNKDKFEYEIIDTGTIVTNNREVKPGMMRIRLK